MQRQNTLSRSQPNARRATPPRPIPDKRSAALRPDSEPPVWAISALWEGHESDADYRHYMPPALEFEQAALGAMLCLHREATAKGMARLHENHFRWPHHRWIFGAIRRLELKRQADQSLSQTLRSIDALSVYEQLDSIGHGGGEEWTANPLPYLMALPRLCPSVANIDFYIARVVEFSTRRHLWELAQHLSRLSARPDADGARLLAALGNAHTQISEFGWCDWKAIFGETK